MRSKKDKNEWTHWIKLIFFTIMIAFLLKTFVFATSTVVGHSMDPILENGEYVIYNKMVYRFSEPERGDIVIIQRPKKSYVKRIIGLPGEIIEMRNHHLYINGKIVKQIFVNRDARSHTENFGPIEILPGNYFVMGDNRAISKDSRNALGFIKRDQIVGKVTLVIYPLKEWSIVN